jgi:outer membrane protein OmpA-like peptidoglycan-associated protein
MRSRHLIPLFVLALGHAARAADVLSLQAVQFAQEGLSVPSLTLSAIIDGKADVSFSCAGRSYGGPFAVKPGAPVTIEIAGLAAGTHNCSGRLRFEASDGTSGEMPLSFAVNVLHPLKLTADRADLDLAGHHLVVRGDRPLSRVRVEVFGEDGDPIGQGETPADGVSDVEIEWSQSGGEAIKLVVTAWDTHELPGSLELSPWSYSIPHEDVVFETGSAVILESEVSKLERAWADLEVVKRRYGAILQTQLFVAGYTDSVGSTSSNQVLSEQRAHSIAQWFSKRGFEGPIWYQGFGEGVLAVPTPDETDEVRNRRAIYVVAAEVPSAGGEMPRTDWTRLH